MINKRLLIKNIISHNDENTFFDKKSQIDIITVPSKAKFLKHISALSNSNPFSESYLIFGISDDSNELLGVDFIDDSNIQNIIKSYLLNAPIVKYENILFSELRKNKTIGLLTITSSEKKTSFSKNIWKIKKGNAFYRYGSNSILIDDNFYVDERNISILKSIYNNSKNNLKIILDGVEEFKSTWGKEYNPCHLVFKEIFVLCWAGYQDNYGEQKYFSEVDIQIINENKRLFFSAAQFVDIEYDDNEFIIIELSPLGFDDNFELYPIRKTVISFKDNGTYNISMINIFNPPKFSKSVIDNLYLRAKKCEQNWRSNEKKLDDFTFAEGIANYYLICYLNGIDTAKVDLFNSREYVDGSAAQWRKECIQILNEYENTTPS